MDGDHLRGRWMQTCDPRLIQRPDHFAYKRALPAMQGWYDYRLCYRQSATERLRSLQAISWSWRVRRSSRRRPLRRGPCALLRRLASLQPLASV